MPSERRPTERNADENMTPILYQHNCVRLRLYSAYAERVENSNPRAAQDLLAEIIIQGVDDYRLLRELGMIRYGRPNYSVINKCKRMPRNMGADEVENVCSFIWGGWMARLLEFAELKIRPIPIYQKLEPKW